MRRSNRLPTYLTLALTMSLSQFALLPRVSVAEIVPEINQEDPGATLIQAVKEADQASKAAEALLNQSNALLTTLTDNLDQLAADADASTHILSLTAALKTFVDDKVDKNLDKSHAGGTIFKLEAASAKLDAAYKAAQSLSKPGTNVEEALNRYPILHNELSEQLNKSAKSRGDLDSKIKDIRKDVGKVIKKYTESIEPLLKIGDKTDPVTLRILLGKSLAALPESVRFRRLLNTPSNKMPLMEHLHALLKATGTDKTDKESPFTDAWDTQLTTLLKKVPSWLTQVNTDAVRIDSAATEILKQYTNDPAGKQADAKTTLSLALDASSDITEIVEASQKLLTELQHADAVDEILPGPDYINTLVLNTRLLERSGIRLGVTISSLQNNYPVNIAAWQSDAVSLYYFDDVPRLMRVLLNNADLTAVGGNSGAQKLAEEAQAEVSKKSLDLLEARGKVSDARTRLAQQQEKTRAAENALTEARARFSSATTMARGRANATLNQKAALQQRADNDEAEIKRLQGLQSLAETREGKAKTEQDTAKTEYDNAVTAAEADPDNTAKRATVIAKGQILRRATNASASATAEVERAKSQVIEAQHKRDLDTAALTRFTTESGDTTSPDEAPEVKEAKKNLEDAQSEEEKARTDLGTAETTAGTLNESARSAATQALIASQVSNLNFAQARDNAPFYMATLNLSAATPSTDPAHRVFLYGFPDSKTIFVRGLPDDIRAVRRMIEQFDRPQAQAMISLYTLEINSDSSFKGAQKASRALDIVDEELDISRVQTDVAVSYLKECINREVSLSVQKRRTDLDTKRVEAEKAIPSAKTASDAAETALQSTIDQAKTTLPALADPANAPLTKAITDSTPVITRLEDALLPLFLKHDSSQFELAFASLEKAIQNANVAASTAKDNLDGLLSKIKSQYDDYKKKRQEFLTAQITVNRIRAEQSYNDEFLGALAFYDPRVLEALGWKNEYINTRSEVPFLSALIPQPVGMTTLAEALVVLSLAKRDSQVKILQDFICPTAGVSKQLHNNLEGMRGISKQELDRLCDVDAAAFRNLRRFIGEMSSQDNSLNVAGAGITGFQKEIVYHLQVNGRRPILSYLWNQARDYYEARAVLANPSSDPAARQEAQVNLANIEQAIQPAARWLYGSATSAATVAESLYRSKENPKTLDEALTELESSQHSFAYQYQFDAAREAATNEALKKYLMSIDDDLRRQFVDPMLTRLRNRIIFEAPLGVGVLEKTSILTSNRLIARVDPSANTQLSLGEEQNILKDTTQLLQLYTAAQTGGATAFLQGASRLDRLPQNAQPGVYGVTTGNTFQITPVFDPSGQALRFRFDYVYSTPIREPNNTTNNQLSTIERHSINTEVQISNHEIRRISQFQSNTRLGLPRRRRGGIPILRDMPGLEDIPLIGWFSLSKGKAAAVQQSLVLAHTTMFPTVRDVLGLLTHPIITPTLKPSTPAPPGP